MRKSYLCRWERAATKSGILDAGGTSTSDGDPDVMKDGMDQTQGKVNPGLLTWEIVSDRV